jgi:hypothetical protein
MLLNAKSVFNKNNYIAMSWQVTFRLDDDDDMRFYTSPVC